MTYNIRPGKLAAIYFLSALGFFSCRQSAPPAVSSTIDQVVIRMPAEPETLSPILAQSTSARMIYQYMFLNLADYDYETLELKPVLLTDMPDERTVTEGPFTGLVAYQMNLKESAQWTDGSPVTGHDLLFTYKIATHPSVQSPTWKELLKEIEEVVVDADNPKSLTVFVRDTYFLNKEALLSAEIYPRHILDPTGVLDDISLKEIQQIDDSSDLVKDTSFMGLGQKFYSIKYSQELVEGAGPYAVESWERGQYLVLKKKEGYWAQNIEDIDQLQANTDRIVFQFLEDETTALSLLKNDEIDLIDLSRAPYKQFDELKSDSSFSARYDFYTPQLPRFLYLMLNNEDVRLAELPVRQALSHLVDVDRIINQLTGGYAKRVNSIIHFSKPAYNKNLPFVVRDPEKARSLLENSGWVDSDNNGVRDKVINGRKEELSLRFFITGSTMSTSMATIMQENCSEAGIKIEIVQKPFEATRSENFITGDYEISILVISQAPASDDPYLYYHSSQVGAGGRNLMRYNSSEADRLMELIRSTKDDGIRFEAYQELQQVIYDDVPVIFLYTPQLRIVSDKMVKPVISSKRPGYFVNARGDN